MTKQTIAPRHAHSRHLLCLGTLSGLLLVAMLAMAGIASAATGPRWEVAQQIPAQVFPGSHFRYMLLLSNVGTAPTSEGLNVHLVAPPGLTFGGTSVLDRPVPAGGLVGEGVPILVDVNVETGAPEGLARMHVEFSGGPGAAPPALQDSQPTEITSTEGPFRIAELDGTSLNEDGSEASQAGAHPHAVSTTIRYTTKLDPDGEVVPADIVKNITVDLPSGYLGNPEAMPKCKPEQLSRTASNFGAADCPPDTQVGTVLLELLQLSRVPVFNVEPQGNAPAEFGFNISGKVIHVFPEVRPGDGGLTVRFRNIDQTLKLFGTTFTLWGSPADHSHDALRLFCGGMDAINPSSGAGCPLAASIPSLAFYSNPTSCQGPVATSFSVASWHGFTDHAQFVSHDNSGNPLGMTGCDRVPFDPMMTTQETTESAESATGLDFGLSLPTDGILNPNGISQANLRKAVVELPEGITANPSAAESLGVCTPADLQREALFTEPGEGCPNASKIGTLHVDTPALDQPIEGSLFLAQPDDPGTAAPGAENPSDSLLAFYMVVRNVARGIFLKIPVKLEPDLSTGQLVATVDNIPQLPFSHFNLHFREGARAPLTSPPACGTYTTDAVLTPWSAAADPAPDEVAHVSATMKVSHGVGGGPCPPDGVPPFKPGFTAGSINNNAGSYSPFTMRLIRNDGEQDMTKFSSILPPGVLGKLAGVSKCPEAAIEAAKAKTGREELASPSCPANSQIGRILAGAGVGPVLTYVGGKVYLGGPYKGDPLSVVVVTSAVAGPFDVGTVVVREALTLNPETAEVEVDGASSDPIPHILKGIPLKVRDLRVYVDRDKFILNPTSCDPSSAKATLFGSYLDVLNPADDVPVGLASRFQAANCANLGFKPKLSLHLRGGTKRGGHPALRAVLNARGADANIGKAMVTLPKSAFLDQAHIRTICTRVQFAAKNCPTGAIYGYAKATTPLLDDPIEGPVYLRSSNHKLPDLVAALHGLVDVNIVGRIDSFKGGIRSSFESIPDAPVTKFVLEMQGGKKGLVVNSRNLCAGKNRANAQFVGQNGKPYDFNPVVKPSCGGKRKR